MPMNRTVGRMWVEALRSGAYSQARSVLQRDGVGHCCLGVLCDLLDPMGWDTPDSASVVRHRSFSGTPTAQVIERAEMRFGDAAHLAFMNDEGKTFTEIADYIETKLMGDDTNGN